MNRTTRRTITGVAKRPTGRTVDAAVTDGEFAGWRAIARADFPAALLAQLQSNRVADVVAAFDAILLEHNMPNSDGELAASAGDVDPYRGMLAVAGAVFDALGKLPPR